MLRVAVVMLAWLALAGSARAERYYFALFAHDSKVPLPFTCHVWGTWAKVGDDGAIAGEVTISWMPVGSWHFIDKAKPGYNMTLRESLEFAAGSRKVIRYWGPFEIDREFYERAEARHRELPETCCYKALDAFSRRKASPAINCFHAVSDIPGKLTTHIRYGLWAGDGIYKHFRKHNLLRATEDEGAVAALLGLKEYRARRR